MERLDGEFREVLSLVAELKEGTIPPRRFAYLQEMLADSPKVREYYAQIVQLYTDMEFLFQNHQE